MIADVVAGVALVAVGDPAANRVVYGSVIALVVIGVVLVGLAIWLIRQTKVDPELLSPLERMSDRSWQRKDPATQRRMLDEVRPDGAEPLHLAPSEPEVVEEFDQPRPIIATFDDLKDPEPTEIGDDAVEAGAGEPPASEDGAVAEGVDGSAEADGEEEPAPLPDPVAADAPTDGDAADAPADGGADDDDVGGADVDDAVGGADVGGADDAPADGGADDDDAVGDADVDDAVGDANEDDVGDPARLPDPEPVDVDVDDGAAPVTVPAADPSEAEPVQAEIADEHAADGQ